MNAYASETLGSLFTGCGGLDLGLERGAGLRTAWQCQHDPDVKKPRGEQPCDVILARHFPDVPNHGDIQRIDWADVEPVTVLAGGFPCQDISNAGLGAGIAVGTRSGLWFEFLRAIRFLRPRVVVVENVSALVARGLGIVQRDLAEAGYDTRWACFRASDLGAPHGRERLFLVATDTRGSHGRADGQGGRDAARQDVLPPERLEDSDGLGAQRQDAADPDGARSSGREHHGDSIAGCDQAPANANADAKRSDGTGRTRAGRRQPPGIRGEAPADTDGSGFSERSEPDCQQVEPGLEAPFGHDIGRRDAPAPDPAVGGWGQGEPDADARQPDIAWGAYEPAIRRWEHLTRPAPAPTDDRGRLQPEFVGWMLGFPAHWTSGVSRTAQLKMLGNSVQVQAGEIVGYAVRSLLEAA